MGQVIVKRMNYAMSSATWDAAGLMSNDPPTREDATCEHTTILLIRV